MSAKNGNFNMACSLLSQMVKGQRSFGDNFGLINGNDIRSHRPTPTTLSLFPGANMSADDNRNETDLDCREPEKSRLTIFYNGKVLVFDDFPGEKAKDLMQLAMSPLTENCPSTLGSLPPAKINQPNSPDLLGQTRRASLRRFLKKRKERINAKSPYQVKSSNKMGQV